MTADGQPSQRPETAPAQPSAVRPTDSNDNTDSSRPSSSLVDNTPGQSKGQKPSDNLSTASVTEPTASVGGGSHEKCPLQLKQFPEIILSETCPRFNGLTSDPSSALAALNPEDLLALSEELDVLSGTAVSRIKRIREELGIIDEYIQSLPPIVTPGPEPVSAAADVTSPAQIQQKIKLNLKKLGEGNGNIPGLVKKADGSPIKKRRRRTSTVTAIASDAEPIQTTRVKEEAPAGRASPFVEDVKLKKKQRATEQQQAQSSVESETPRESAAPPTMPEEPKIIKPSQQIPFTTFWNYVDQFFRPLTEADLKILEESDENEKTPYIIPPKGRTYREMWAEEDKSLLPAFESPSTQSSTAVKEKKSKKSLGGSSDKRKTPEPAVVYNNLGISEDCFCLPLTERVVGAIMENDAEYPSSLVASEDELSPVTAESFRFKEPSKEEIYTIEERIKSELKYLGLLDDTEIASKDDADDEISVELKRLQSDLRKITQLNDRRKIILRDLVMEHLAYQEYRAILDEINRQVFAYYQKRFRMSVKKRKLSLKHHNGVRALLDRRRRLIEEFAPIFPAEKFALPETSIFGDESELLEQISFLTHPDPIIIQKPPTPPPPPTILLDTATIDPMRTSEQAANTIQATNSQEEQTGSQNAADTTSNSVSTDAADGKKKKRGPKAGVKPRKSNVAVPSKTLPGSGTVSQDLLSVAGSDAPAVKKKRGPKKKKAQDTADKMPPSVILGQDDSQTLLVDDVEMTDAGSISGTEPDVSSLLVDGMIPDWLL